MTLAPKPYPSGLVWLRRDLRSHDHAALHQALRQCQRVWCVFVFDTDILQPLLERGLQADRRVEFIHESLIDLDEQLRALGRSNGTEGVGLLVCHGRASEEIPRLATQLGVQAVYANLDHEPAALARDAQVRGALAHAGVLLHMGKDQVVREHHEVLNQGGRPFTVFTPYKKAWLQTLSPSDLQPHPVERYADALAPCPPALSAGVPTLEAIGFVPSNLRELNEHVHFHVCAVDGVFEEVAGEEGDAADAASQSSPSRIIFHPATGVTADAVGQVQASLRKRILRAFVGRGLLERLRPPAVCHGAAAQSGQRAGLPLRQAAHSEPGSLPHNKRGVKADEITLTPLELIERIAKLVPSAAHAPPPLLWRAGTELTLEACRHGAGIRQILEHIGVETEPPHITPARGPPLWDECDAQAAEGVEPAPDWDEATQPAPDFEVDQRVSW